MRNLFLFLLVLVLCPGFSGCAEKPPAKNPLGIQAEDLMLGGIPLGTFEDALPGYIAEEPLSVSEQPRTNYPKEKRRLYTYESGLILELADPEQSDSWRVVLIKTASQAYETSRGLRVSDDIKTVKTLYGDPWFDDTSHRPSLYADGLWEFRDETGDYPYLFVQILKGEVAEIIAAYHDDYY